MPEEAFRQAVCIVDRNDHERADRRKRLQAIRLERCDEKGTGFARDLLAARHLGRIFERGRSGEDRRVGDVVPVAQRVDGVGEPRRPDDVADPEPREPVELREGAQHRHIRARACESRTVRVARDRRCTRRMPRRRRRRHPRERHRGTRRARRPCTSRRSGCSDCRRRRDASRGRRHAAIAGRSRRPSAKDRDRDGSRTRTQRVLRVAHVRRIGHDALVTGSQQRRADQPDQRVGAVPERDRARPARRGARQAARSRSAPSSG